jgi:2-C-methyl-D-erythritol 2,4-cyclodiphosphate synthase
MMRVGLGYDVHPFGGEGPLVLGGVTIEGPGLSGHSDADVVSHAVADAMLSSTGLPDLGELYPATDDRYRGASSIELLREIAGRLARERWTVGNVDVVVAAEHPKLSPHIATMVANLDDALSALREPFNTESMVSIAPKHGEGVGFVGRGEGIAAWAVALLHRD